MEGFINISIRDFNYPNFEEDFDKRNLWDKLNSYEWGQVLAKQPSVVSKCKDLRILNTFSWATILRNYPEYIEKCNCINEFNDWDWKELLSDQPQFADKCDKFIEFEINDWKKLLIKQPCLIEYAKKHKAGWVAVIIQDINESKNFKEWESLELYDWSCILREHAKNNPDILKLANEYSHGWVRSLVNDENYYL